MTSFYADSFFFISNRPDCVCAFLSSTRPFFHSSIIPVTMNIPELWDELFLQERIASADDLVGDLLVEDPIDHTIGAKNTAASRAAAESWRIINIFRHSHTLQFSPSIRSHFTGAVHPEGRISACECCERFVAVLFNIGRRKRYALRTVKHFSTCDLRALDQICSSFLAAESLEFSCCSAFVPELNSIGKLTLLKKLKLATQSGDKVLEGLSGCVSLTHLDLSGNRSIDGSCLAHFMNMKNLVHLDLSETCLSDNGLCCLPSLPSLRFLDISRASASLGRNSFGDIGFSSVAKQNALTSLVMRRCANVTSEGLKNLVGLIHLAHLDMSYFEQVNGECLRVLATMEGSLRSLSLKQTSEGIERRVSDDALVQFLSEMNDLTSLDLSYLSSISCPSVVAASNLRSLNTLSIPGVGINVPRVSSDAVKSLSALLCLNMSLSRGCFLAHGVVSALSELKNLISLTVIGVEEVAGYFGILARSTSIEKIGLIRCGGCWENCVGLFEINSLRELVLEDCSGGTFRVKKRKVYYCASDLLRDATFYNLCSKTIRNIHY